MRVLIKNKNNMQQSFMLAVNYLVWLWSHLIGDFFPRVDSLAPVSVIGRIVIPEELSRAIRTDQLQYCLLPPLRHDARIGRTVPRLTTDSNGGGGRWRQSRPLCSSRRLAPAIAATVHAIFVPYRARWRCMSFDVPTTLQRDEGPESSISGAESAARIS